MNIVDTSKSFGFVIPANAGKRAIPGEFRGTAIQFNQNAGFRDKPGMTALMFILLFIVLWLPLSAHAAKNILVFGDSLSAGYGIA
ncbi:MAG: hypothetical protein Q8J90_06000, partial [Gallionella sp.]|nr:hypothetical protein [Gallionella sp.]